MKRNQKHKKISKPQQWIKYGQRMRRFIVFFDQKVLDLTDFLDSHPGGSKAIQHYRNKNISKILFQVYPHSPYAKSLLMLYSIGQLELKATNQENIQQLCLQKSPVDTQNRKGSILKNRRTPQSLINEQQKKYVEFNSHQNQVYTIEYQNMNKSKQKMNNKEDISIKSAPQMQNLQDNCLKTEQEEAICQFNLSDKQNTINMPDFSAKFERI